MDAYSTSIMEVEINGDFSSLQPAKPTNTLKKTGHRDDDVTGSMDMVVQTCQSGEMGWGQMEMMLRTWWNGGMM